MKIGILGLDTSHGPAFVRILRGNASGHELVGAWPGGSESIPASRDRVRGFTEEVRALGVPIFDSAENLAEHVEALFLLTLDADTHWPLFRAVARPGLRVFIDKPLASTRSEAEQIFDLANQKGCNVFSSSALRFLPVVQNVLGTHGRRGIHHLSMAAPLNAIDGVPKYHFYAIHAVEVLVTLLGADVPGRTHH